jgi:uncharacterized membrane protein
MPVPWLSILVGAGQVKPGWHAPVLWTTLALIAALLVAALVLAVLERWRKRSDSERLSPGEQLSQFRKLYEKGQLSREEFERIRNLLGGKLREELHLPTRQPAEAAPAAQTGIQALDDRLRPPPQTGMTPSEPEHPPPGPENGPSANGPS